MSQPKLHHYVPQFYLRRFVDASGLLWLWDREQDRVLRGRPNKIAAENGFYRIPELAANGHDPLTMEKQFSCLESEIARITDHWVERLRHLDPGEKIEIPPVNRELMSTYLALQSLRTVDTREILAAFVQESEKRALSLEEKQQLHTDLLWHEETVRELATRIERAAWVFGRNTTSTPFVTSDNPLAFRTGDNAMWLKVAIYSAGTYSVFPLTPDLVMYCYPAEAPWEKLSRFDLCLSPVLFTDEMVQSENTGQVFMASRFIISSRSNFDRERKFAKTRAALP